MLVIRRGVVLAVLAGLLLPAPAEAERRRRGGLRIQVNSSPPGATIYLEGEEESSGTTPQWIDLRRQTYRVRLELDGYAPLEDEINVRRAWLRFNFDLERLGRIELRNTDETARGATVTIDGEEVGTVPLSHELIPGRHSFTVSREGYHEVTRWFEVAGGQNYVVDLAMRPVPPPQGEVLIAADVSGAEVSIDGSPAGTTPMIAELEPGEHAIEIRAEGLEPHSEVVTVEAGQRVTLSATLQPSRPPGGTLVVITAPPGATVVVDGNERGTAPITVEELTPGSHIVEARLEEHQEVTERVDIEEGRQATLRLELEVIPEGGGLRITSSVDGAEVLLDGEPIGRAPVTHRDIEPGEHVIVVRAPGHREWERRINIESGVDLMVEATPDGFGRLNVTSDVEDAEVVIDEQVVGTVPLTSHELATGDHTVVIRAEGREPFRTTVTVEAGTTHQVAAQLGGATASPAPLRPAPALAGVRPRPLGAAVLPLRLRTSAPVGLHRRHLGLALLHRRLSDRHGDLGRRRLGPARRRHRGALSLLGH